MFLFTYSPPLRTTSCSAVYTNQTDTTLIQTLGRDSENRKERENITGKIKIKKNKGGKIHKKGEL